MRQHVTAALLTLTLMLATSLAASAADDAGHALYEKKCKVCHSIGGEGGKLADKGGPLDEAASKHDAEWLHAYLANPKSKMPDAKMPNLKLAPSDIDALVAYLESVKKK